MKTSVISPTWTESRADCAELLRAFVTRIRHSKKVRNQGSHTAPDFWINALAAVQSIVHGLNEADSSSPWAIRLQAALDEADHELRGSPVASGIVGPHPAEAANEGTEG
jgi:hypothetical protein